MATTQRYLRGLIAALAVLSCDSPSAPKGPEYGLDIVSPTENAITGDTLVQISGIVRVPPGGKLLWLSWYMDDGSVPNVLFNSQLMPQVDSLQFSFTQKLSPGVHTVHFFVKYENEKTVMIDVDMGRSFNVYKKPTYRIAAGVADTVYQRSLMVDVSHDGIMTSSWHANLVLDPGTPSEKLVDNAPSSPDYGHWQEKLSDNAKRLYYPFDTLSQGKHRVRVRFYENGTLRDSLTRDFVLALPLIPYALTPLESLGGSAAQATTISESGLVAGWALDASEKKRAVTWHSGAIEALDAEVSEAVTITESGAVFGNVNMTATSTCAARWEASTRTILRRPSDGACLDGVAAASSSGIVVGRIGGASLLLRPDGSTVALVVPGSCYPQSFEPKDVNRQEQVVGTVFGCFLYTIPVALGFTATYPSAFSYAGASSYSGRITRINDAGQFIGSWSSPTGTKLFIGRVGEQPIPLSGAFSVARLPSLIALSESGAVLAFDYPAQVGYLWKNGRTSKIVLAPSGWTVTLLHGMNSAGRIVGAATGPAGEKRAVVLMPQ